MLAVSPGSGNRLPRSHPKRPGTSELCHGHAFVDEDSRIERFFTHFQIPVVFMNALLALCTRFPDSSEGSAIAGVYPWGKASCPLELQGIVDL
jgi:hypothetical protein